MAIQTNFPAIKPTLNLDFANTKAVDPRITFVRSDSQPIARYYDGKTTAKAEENLLQNSNAFSNGAYWGAYQTVATANAATAPDGTATASKLSEVASTIGHYLNLGYGLPFVAGQVITFSIHVKKGDGATAPDYVQLFAAQASTTNSVANFNISTGTVTSTTNCTAAVASLGSGWYRISITYTVSGSFSSNNVGLAMTNNNATAGYVPVYAGSVSADIYVWGAQLEQRSTVTAYTPTTSQPITNYIPVLQTAAVGAPRIDHDPVTGECKGLLIEEQRTNLLTYSEQFDNAVWTKGNVAITANAAIAPDGTLTADLLKSISSIGTSATASVTATGTQVTYSIYVKKGSGATEANNFTLRNSTASANLANLTIDYSTGIVTQSVGAGAYAVAVGNGWFRLVIPAATGIAIGDALTVYAAFSGNTPPAGAYAFVWGAQLEVGAFPTSYIKTEASQVTRTADSASMTGTNVSSWYRQDEGTFYSDTISFGGVLSPRALTAFGPTTAEQIAIGADVTRVRSGAVDIGAFYPVSVLTGKRAVAYAVNQQAAARDGASTSSTNSGIPSGIATLYIGATIGSAALLNGTIKRIAYYPKRLSNTELQALTT